MRLPARDKTPETITIKPTIKTALPKAKRRSITESASYVGTFQAITPKDRMSMLTPEALIGHYGKRGETNVAAPAATPR